MSEKNKTIELNEEDLEKVSGGYRKIDSGGYEFVIGDCFKQGAHAVLRVRKYCYGVDGLDKVKCQKFGQNSNGTYYYIMDLEVTVNSLLKGEYLGYDFVVK